MEQQPAVENKNWGLSGLFSFLIPGFGQLYNGDAAKGLVFFIPFFLLKLILRPAFEHYLINPDTLTRSMALTLFSMFCAIFLLNLLAIVDAIRSAIKSGRGCKPKFYNRSSVYVCILVAYSGFTFLLPSPQKDFGDIKTFKIPSQSMQPTVEAGDYLACDLTYYRSHPPRRGDIIVFRYPGDENIDYIKRIIGLPGDTIELRQNILYVNDKKIEEPYAVYGGNGDGPKPLPQNYGPYFISENEYFVMGDNRDNSSDSRFFGSFGHENIEGKAILVYFSWDMKRPLWSFPGRLASIRFSRIGKIL